MKVINTKLVLEDLYAEELEKLRIHFGLYSMDDIVVEACKEYCMKYRRLIEK